jgi:hypothetical protein
MALEPIAIVDSVGIGGGWMGARHLCCSLSALGAGDDGIDVAAAALAADEALVPIGEDRLGAVALGQRGWVGLDLVAAIAAPHDEPRMSSGGAAECRRRPGVVVHRRRRPLLDGGSSSRFMVACSGVDCGHPDIAIILATTMFVRFRETSRRLQLSLVETRREGGKVRHEHVASFGAIATPLTVAGRVEFWQDLHQRLGRLSNRLDSKMQVKILGAVHARVPMPTVDEIHALNLEEAKQHETAWRARYVRTEAIVEENKARLKAAERMVTRGEPLVATAAEEVKAAEQRRERIERGESVSLPGKVPTLKELGITPAHAEYMIAVSQLAPEQFERFLEFGHRTSDYRRRDYARLRRFLRAEAKRRATP